MLHRDSFGRAMTFTNQWKGTDFFLKKITTLQYKDGTSTKELEVKDSSERHPNLNPPFQILLFSPFGLFDYQTAFWIWFGLSLILGVASIYVVVSTSCPNENPRARLSPEKVTLFSLPFFFYFPSFLNIAMGQLAFLLFFLLSLAWVFSRSGKDAYAGFALGVALSLKLFVGIFLLFFLVLRRWRLLGWMIGTSLGCSLLALAALGIDSYQQYRGVLSNITWFAGSWNGSFMGFFTRLFGGADGASLLEMPRLGYFLLMRAHF